jgi:hypothetical protein
VAVPVNTVLPALSGTAAEGNPLTGTLGTWTGSPTIWAYEFRIVRNIYANQYLTHGSVAYITIPGTSGTTTNPAFTPTYNLINADASRAVYLHVSASNASGPATADSTHKIFYATAPPFKSLGNPFLTPLPGVNGADAPISSSLTATLQAQITSWRAGGANWWVQGGDYGDTNSPYLHIVDSSMPRTPFKLLNNVGSISLPAVTAIDNGPLQNQFAWDIGVRDGGVPTPPCGFMVPFGSDHPVCVYVTDTKQYYEFWVVFQNPVAADWDAWTDQVQHSSLTGHYTCAWGGYMDDVTQNPGYWYGDTQAEDGQLYKLDADGKREYAYFGTAATSLPQYATNITTGELIAGSIEHAIGLITPGSNGTHIWPAQRHDTGSGGNLTQGGRWQLDPSINVAALTSLGHAGADHTRLAILTACQKYGLIVCDSSASDLALRMESLGGTWPTIPGAQATGVAPSFGVVMNQIMESVPVTAWRHVSTSYRTPGAPAVPETRLLQDRFTGLDASKWVSYGTPAPTVSGGRLRFQTPTGAGGAVLVPTEQYFRSLTGSTAMIEVVQPAGNVLCIFYVHPNDNTTGVSFNFTGSTLECRYHDEFGTIIGSNTVLAYSATDHRWVRFREASGNLYWETSPGGGGTDPTAWTWTTRRTEAVTWSVDSVAQTIFVQGSDTGEAVFDNLNTTNPGVVWAV